MADLVLRTETNPGDATWVDIDNIVNGVTVIPDGGEINGTYETSVICLGNVAIVGPTIVDMDLIVRGDLVEDDAFPLTVHGDLIVNESIDYRNVTTSQASIVVDGDLVVGDSIYIPQQGGSSSSITVGGSMTVEYECNMVTTVEGTAGGTISVTGDFVGSLVYLGLDPLSGPTDSGGHGGNFYVLGNASVSYILSTVGGRGVSSGIQGGNGGNIGVGGTLTALEIYAQGTKNINNDGSSGSGGSVTSGPLASNYLDASGADCSSATPTHFAGSGGSLSVGGTWSVNVIRLFGGLRDGTVVGSTGSPGTAPGGNANLRGSGSASIIDMYGGIVVNNGGTSMRGGNAGNLTVLGDLAVHGTGLSGRIYVFGGDSYTDIAGNGGVVTIRGNLACNLLLSVGGSGNNPSQPPNLHGGVGGNVTVLGNCAVRSSLDTVGGFSYTGNGGNGGITTINGTAVVQYIITEGGYSTSTNPTHGAGNGGNLTIYGSCTCTSISTAGGNRSGLLTGTGSSSTVGRGGNVTCLGSVVARTGIYTSGGANTTTGGFAYNAATPPNGGIIVVNGSMEVGEINSSGGNQPTGNGGIGGNIAVDGFVVCGNITSKGGNGSTTNGYAGNGTFNGGINMRAYDAANGAGAGADPVSVPTLTVGGNCSFISISMPALGVIRPSAAGTAIRLCVLRIGSMITKTTLNKLNGTPTGPESANFATHLYYSVPTGDWYRVLGTLVP